MAEFFAGIDSLTPLARFGVVTILIGFVLILTAPYFALNHLRGIHDEMRAIRKALEEIGGKR